MADEGGLAQLARALALQAKGHRFDSDILHYSNLAMFKFDNLKMKFFRLDVDYRSADS